MSQPAIVVIPGAWQKPIFFKGFCDKLQEAGFLVHLVAPPTIGGTEPQLAGLKDDVNAVRTVLTELAREGRKIVIIGHSSGGLVASNAAEGLDIAGIIFLSAFMVPKGKSLLSLLGGNPLPWMDVQGDRVLGVPGLIPEIAFNDLNPNDQAIWAARMTHTSAALFAEPSDFEPWSNSIKCGYIFCANDNALPLPMQQQMAAQLGPDPVVATIGSGHCPHLSMPDELVKTVVMLVTKVL